MANKRRLNRIEIHRKEGQNNKVKTEYRIYINSVTYTTKTKSQLTKSEKEFMKNNKVKEVFHF